VQTKTVFIFGILLGLLFISACSDRSTGESETSPESDVENSHPDAVGDESVTLLAQSLYFYREELQETVEEHFAHVSLEWISHYEKKEPDIIQLLNADSIPYLYRDEMAYGLDDLIEKHDFDLTVYKDHVIDGLRALSPEGEIVMLPILEGRLNLYYNKNIFDRFGVQYPTDNMTWDEVIDLARQTTVEEDGVQYIGLDWVWPQLPLEQRTPKLVNPKTGEVHFVGNNDVQVYMEMIERIVSIPGLVPDHEDDFWSSVASLNHFYEEENVAMVVFGDSFTSYKDHLPEGSWDVVTFPEWSDLEGVGRPLKMFSGFAINPESEHKDLAFEILVADLLNEERQKQSVRRWGSISTLHTDDEILSQFALDVFEDEEQVRDTYNYEAVYKQIPEPPRGDVNHMYERIAQNTLMKMLWDFAHTGADIDAFLREAEVKAQADILYYMEENE
jgi:multiple sugar transport system substrate-binding protein